MIFEEHIPEYTLASRAHQNEDTTVAAGSVKIGAGCPVAVMAA